MSENEKTVGGNFTVELRKNETVETMIKRFLRKQKKEKLIEEIIEGKSFVKPSVRRRQEKIARESVLKKLREKEREVFSDR